MDRGLGILRLLKRETELANSARLSEVRREIEKFGFYELTPEELDFGTKVAWRNSNRCIGRLFWQSLVVRDRRHCRAPHEIAGECFHHLRLSTNGGKIKPVATVFQSENSQPGCCRIRNPQLVRYAGYSQAGEKTLGDPLMAEFTKQVIGLGWQPRWGAFDVLPLVVARGDSSPELFEIPSEYLLEVKLIHPEYPWFETLGLKWPALPAISNMRLEIGGLRFPCAPFSGWYVSTEIATRNFGDEDRYDLLPTLAAKMGLDTKNNRSLWKDTACMCLA